MKKAKSGLKGLIIFLICMIEVYPLFWMLTASLKEQYEWSEYPAYALNKDSISRTTSMRGRVEIWQHFLRTV